MISKSLFLSAAMALTCGLGFSQDKKQQDIKSIKSMCGCYEVKFNFTETFSYPKDSLTYKPSETKHESALEWVELLEDTPNKIVMQHLLIVSDDMIIKHWRQDWLYENTDLYSFDKGTSWKYKKLDKKAVKGQWTQKVYQVDDSPRYEGSSTWVHVDGQDYWANVADAPLPRREQTKRNDYNVLKRRNIHEITATGWNHEQDNDKLVRDDAGKDVLLAQEKGFDVYTKVPDVKCIAAQKWWKENNALWKNVRDKWQTLFDRHKDLNLEAKVDRKALYSLLFDLKPDAAKAETDKIIDKFVK
ncbi:DUF6607 family protein [Flavobacterium sp. S87F.05.LMB.W.Kidney.N]|uniref:DUF6607 family protein n=1 Tax=Flavobacterium sp. S87F.05.LMB.W.Kidney.N TaxID=1278758 RepID=UPI001066F986|nr:DUF6607 family protein [Flavobacterium sp. S87F.05.LMB.W.Kidney.N]TDX09363.1 hypothetical protein EDB96_3657 [Flavobacterium sp. S87F.05.LMB.W.Kidney.N]